VTKAGAAAGSVVTDERIRIFCGLQLADETIACLAAWQVENLPVGRVVPPENLHVTLAFLGHRPAAEVPAVAHELREAAASAGRIELRPVRYRETRSVGMVVLEDVGGAASALAEDVQERLERLRVYRREGRAWLPHITVLRFRERAGLSPEPPNMCSIHVVRSALYRSALGAGGARYEVLETGVLGGR
jgi:RNA 2',3'-cyclic 3'-phosphodiesterase